MILKSDSTQYINARNYWSENKLKDNSLLSTRYNSNEYYSLVVKPFRDWLREQGCEILMIRDESMTYGIDSYEVAIGWDILVFESEKDFTVFLLKWS